MIEAPYRTWDDFQQLSRDKVKLDQVLRTCLVAVAFGHGSSAACRAIEFLFGLPSDALGDDIGKDDFDAAEVYAVGYLRSLGYVVERVPVAGATESEGIHPVHDAGVRTQATSRVDDDGDPGSD